jgi:hypothetical protein
LLQSIQNCCQGGRSQLAGPNVDVGKDFNTQILEYPPYCAKTTFIVGALKATDAGYYRYLKQI